MTARTARFTAASRAGERAVANQEEKVPERVVVDGREPALRVRHRERDVQVLGPGKITNCGRAVSFFGGSNNVVQGLYVTGNATGIVISNELNPVVRDNVVVRQKGDGIDIGGVTLIRAAAKNFARVVVLCDPEVIRDQELYQRSRKEHAELAQEGVRRLRAPLQQPLATGDLAAEMQKLEAKAWELSGNVPSGNRRSGWWRAPGETSWRHLAATLEALKHQIQELDQKVRILERKQELEKETATEKAKTTPTVSLGATFRSKISTVLSAGA